MEIGYQTGDQLFQWNNRPVLNLGASGLSLVMQLINAMSFSAYRVATCRVIRQ